MRGYQAYDGGFLYPHDSGKSALSHSNRIGQGGVPALIIAGQHELAIMRRSARDLAATLPASQGYLVSFSKRGAEEHGWNLHRPELFNTVTRAWLTDQPLPPGLLPLK